MVALGQYEASLCSGCGSPTHESFDKHNEWAYDATQPWICHACVAKHQGAESWAKNNDLTPGHRFLPEYHPERRVHGD